MSEIKPVYYYSHQITGSSGLVNSDLVESGFFNNHLMRNHGAYYPAAAYEALQENCAKLLDKQDREYNRKTNELINRHADQVEALQKENAELKANLIGERNLRNAAVEIATFCADADKLLHEELEKLKGKT